MIAWTTIEKYDLKINDHKLKRLLENLDFVANDLNIKHDDIDSRCCWWFLNCVNTVLTEVENNLKKLNNYKAPGYDIIHIGNEHIASTLSTFSPLNKIIFSLLFMIVNTIVTTSLLV